MQTAHIIQDERPQFCAQAGVTTNRRARLRRLFDQPSPSTAVPRHGEHLAGFRATSTHRTVSGTFERLHRSVVTKLSGRFVGVQAHQAPRSGLRTCQLRTVPVRTKWWVCHHRILQHSLAALVARYVVFTQSELTALHLPQVSARGTLRAQQSLLIWV
jgi:hypothetical protein